MRYLVTITVPEPAYTAIAELQSILQSPTRHQTIGPHITLLAPDPPLLDAEPATTTFTSTVTFLQIAQFTITASRLLIFSRRGYHTLVLQVEPKPTLVDIFNHLVETCSWQQTTASTRRPYEPHITLANGLSTPQLAAARLKLQQSGSPSPQHPSRHKKPKTTHRPYLIITHNKTALPQ